MPVTWKRAASVARRRSAARAACNHRGGSYFHGFAVPAVKEDCATRAPAHGGRRIQKKSKIRFLLGDDVFQQARGKVVLDFGCGEGVEAVELAQNGAARVIGVDNRKSVLRRAEENAIRAGVDGKCEFCSDISKPVDLIISVDSFEHFDDPGSVLRRMYDLLKPGGAVLASFGPTWYHPYGGHLFSVFPWAHLIFSERALIRWRSDIRRDGASRFCEVEGG